MEERSVFCYGQYFSVSDAWNPLKYACLKKLGEFNFLILETTCLKGQRNLKEGNWYNSNLNS